MRIPDCLAGEDRLVFVVGAVTRGEARLEYGSRTLQQVLGARSPGDMSWSVSPDRNPQVHKTTVRSNLAALEQQYATAEFYPAAVALMHEIIGLVDERNRVAHTMWLGLDETEQPGFFPPSMFFDDLTLLPIEVRTSMDEFVAIGDRMSRARLRVDSVAHIIELLKASEWNSALPEGVVRRMIGIQYDLLNGDYDKTDTGVQPHGTWYAAHFPEDDDEVTT